MYNVHKCLDFFFFSQNVALSKVKENITDAMSTTLVIVHTCTVQSKIQTFNPKLIFLLIPTLPMEQKIEKKVGD